jgi:hypothetical protein
MTTANFDPEQLVRDVEALKAWRDQWEPVLTVLKDRYSGEVAGVGETEQHGVVIPAEEIGSYVAEAAAMGRATEAKKPEPQTAPRMPERADQPSTGLGDAIRDALRGKKSR